MWQFCTLAASYQNFCAVRCDISVNWQLAINNSVLWDVTVLYTGSLLSTFLCCEIWQFCKLAASYQHCCAVRCDSSVNWQLAINISVLWDVTVLYTGSLLSTFLFYEMWQFCTLTASYQHFCAVRCDSSVHWQLAINISVLWDVTVLYTGS
jgi:hypothetical protein